MFEELFCEKCNNTFFKISVSGRYLLCEPCKILWQIKDLQDVYKERLSKNKD
jgi:hypothetical protein